MIPVSFFGKQYYQYCVLVVANTDGLPSGLMGSVGLVPAQDEPFFFTRSHLSALQNCALLFSTNFHFIFIFKNA